MLTTNMRALYRRLLVLTVLCASLIFFLSRPATEEVFAAGCLENCEPQEAQCVDACTDECESDDTSCSNCVTQCSADRNYCNAHSYTCGQATNTYEGQCYVGYAQHCPWDNGLNDFNCSSPNSHNGYYQICTTIGNVQCVACPGAERCVGSNGLPACPGS